MIGSAKALAEAARRKYLLRSARGIEELAVMAKADGVGLELIDRLRKSAQEMREMAKL